MTSRDVQGVPTAGAEAEGRRRSMIESGRVVPDHLPEDVAVSAPEGIAEEFAELAVRLHDEPTVDATLETVLEYAVRAMGCDYAAVIFLHGNQRLETAAATDPRVAHLEQLQMRLGEGPDLDVLEEGQYRLIADTHQERRWPRWVEEVAAYGLRSQLAVRLHTSATTVGTLNLYDDEPDAFDEEDVGVAQVLARHAAVALASARDLENVWHAVDSRKLIGQAQGMLMERYRLDAEQALAVLLRYSQNSNLKLRVVAERLVATSRLPDLPSEAARDAEGAAGA